MSMDDEDDYDFDDELEQALADDKEAKPQKTNFLAGPGLPTGADLLPQQPGSSSLPGPSSSAAPPEPPGASELGTATESEAEAAAALTPVDPEQQAREEDARQKQALLEMMNEDQLNRYEAFRRSALNRKSMRRLYQAVTGQNSNAANALNVSIIMCGVAKMFAGELVEEARSVAAEQGNFGPLQPSHIHAAFQRLEAQEKIPSSGLSKRRRL